MLASPISQYPLDKSRNNSPKNSDPTKSNPNNSLQIPKTNCRGSPQVNTTNLKQLNNRKRNLALSNIHGHSPQNNRNLSLKKFIKHFKIDSAENSGVSSCSSSDSENNNSNSNIENMNPDNNNNSNNNLSKLSCSKRRNSKSLTSSPMKVTFNNSSNNNNNNNLHKILPTAASNILQNRKRQLCPDSASDSMDCSSNHVTKKFIRPYQHSAVTYHVDPNGMSDGSIITSNQESSKSLKDSTSRTLDNLSTNALKSTFESKFKYYKRLKQLPSQIIKMQAQENQINQNNNNNNLPSSSTSSTSTNNCNLLTKDPRKVNVDDAIKILEHILVEQEEKMKEEFQSELYKRLNDQYESFQRFKEEFMRNSGESMGNYECSYLS